MLTEPGHRLPSSTIVVDANVFLSTILGRHARPVFDLVRDARVLITSDRAMEEVRGVMLGKTLVVPNAHERIARLVSGLGVIPSASYANLLPAAEYTLRHAVASRNGSVRDAHLLACAWAYDADIWTHDRDFAGTGWPSWSNANLGRALAEEAVVPA